MDRIELAERRYRPIKARPSCEWAEFPLREVQVWLDSDVMHVIEDYVGRPTFRRHACWPLTELTPGVNTPGRVAVDAVDAALVKEARALVRVAGRKRVAQALVDMRPPESRRVVSSIMISAGSSETTYRMATFDDLQFYQHQVERIAGRPWTDLVSTDDYFEPQGGLLLERPPRGATEAAFVVEFNPELHPIGDFVTRCMTRRVEIWRKYLEVYRRWCLDAVRQVGGKDTASTIAERQAWDGLASATSSLRVLCSSGPDAAVRDSCVTLTQVYAAFHPRPDLSWLGLPEALIAGDAGVPRHRVTSVQDVAMVDRIAAALHDLRRLYEDSSPDQSAREEAIASRGLVLVRQARQVYWEAEQINVDWHRFDRPWSLLVALAEKAPRGAAVSLGDVYGSSDVSDSALSSLEGRLKKTLPSSLWKLIRPTGQKSYRLHLGRDRVHVLP